MDIKDVETLAKLARIELKEEEKEEILGDMKGILEYVKQIEGVEVGEIEVDHSLVNAWREDVPEGVRSGESRDLIVEQFPDAQDGFLKVKKIL